MTRRWWARLIQPRSFHHRANGPVVLDPDKRGITHVVGRK